MYKDYKHDNTNVAGLYTGTANAAFKTPREWWTKLEKDDFDGMVARV